MRSKGLKRPSPAMVVALIALFVALSGAGYAATGGNFILGQANSADATSGLNSTVTTGATLNVTNSGGRPAARFSSNTGVAPFAVSNSSKITNLNSDKLDNIDSTGFLRNLVPLSLTGSDGTAVIRGENTGGGNGLQGKTGSSIASGVYAENSGGGFGLAARSNGPGGVAVFGEATGAGGRAGLFTGKVQVNGDLSVTGAAHLNADKVDGASFLSNRIVSTTQFDHILDLPGFGSIYVDGCDHTNTRWGWNSGGPNAYVNLIDTFNPGDSLRGSVSNVIVSATRPNQFQLLQLARDTGGNTSSAQVWVTANATDCVFAAQAVVYPG